MDRQCRKCLDTFTPNARQLRQCRHTCRACEAAMDRSRTGSKQRIPLTRENLIDRCEPVPEVGCWLWAGAWSAGYGVYGYPMRRTHRISYELHNGPIPTGLLVCHRCNTPACVNPDHLYAGTHTQNMLDRRGRPRKSVTTQEARA